MGVEGAPDARGAAGGRRRLGDAAPGPAGTGEARVGGGLPQVAGDARAEALMRRALDIAAETPAGDVPVGAVILGPDGRELGRA